MRPILLLIVILAALPALAQYKGPEMIEILGQPKDVWERLITLNDNSTVDVNTSTISWPGDDLGRVRYRYLYTKPQFLPDDSDRKYKKQVTIIEFDCGDRLYRTWSVHYFDSDERLIFSSQPGTESKWREIQVGITGGARITSAGCGLIKTASGGKIKLGAPKPTQPPESNTSPEGDRPTLKRRVRKDP